MRFRTGLAIGFGVGYVLGAKAGRERYHQIQRAWQKVTDDPVVGKVVAQGRAAVDISTAAAREAISNGLNQASEKVREAVEGAA